MTWTTPKAAEILIFIIQGTKYLLKTDHGLNKRTCSITNLHIISLIGQESGGGPSIWTIILDTILWSVSKKYNNFILEIPTKQIITYLGDSYVDNTFQVITNHPKYHPQNFKNIQESISMFINKAT